MMPVLRTIIGVADRARPPRRAALVTPADGRRGPSRFAPAGSVDAISDYATFVHLEAEWNDAVERAGLLHPFLRHEWVRTWWDAFAPPGARLSILVVRAEGRITAIAPFMRETVPMYGVPTRQIRFIQNDHTPRTDIIIAARSEESYRALWQALRADRAPWDVLQLSPLERNSDTRRVFGELAAADGCATGVWPSSDSPYLSLTGTWDDYLARLPAKFRSNLRNRLSRLTRLGEPVLEVLSGRSAIDAACEEAWRLESSGWKREAGTAIACDPAVHRFYTTLVERGTAAGWLQLLFLTVGGRRIATAYGACFKGRLFLFKTGYDPEFATGAPFKILTYFAIREAYARRLTEVDFLGDAEPWKREWTPTSRGHDWLFVFADTMRARLLHALKFRRRPGSQEGRA
jgi:CelD/BcsL family acetyltransferase involved in cellulose biosynthesis